MIMEEAIERVVSAWGVDDKIKVTAVRLLLRCNNDRDKIVGAICEIANGLGYLESLKGATG